MTPAEAFDKLLSWVGARDHFSRRPRNQQPGEIILKQPSDVRDALTKLTASDLQVRDSHVACLVEPPITVERERDRLSKLRETQ